MLSRLWHIDILREQYDGSSGWWATIQKEKWEYYYRNNFWNTLTKVWNKTYFFEWFNARIFSKHYQNTSLQKKMVFLEGIITHGQQSLQALVNDCSFVWWTLINSIEKNLVKLWDLLAQEYVDEEILDSVIIEISETIDLMNMMFYTNSKWGRNPFLQDVYKPVNLSRQPGSDIGTFISDTAQKIHNLTDWTFVSDSERNGPWAIHIWGRGGTMC